MLSSKIQKSIYPIKNKPLIGQYPSQVFNINTAETRVNNQLYVDVTDFQKIKIKVLLEHVGIIKYKH